MGGPLYQVFDVTEERLAGALLAMGAIKSESRILPTEEAMETQTLATDERGRHGSKTNKSLSSSLYYGIDLRPPR